MGERKVINKYYPPDFDPSKLPRGRRPKNDQFKVRMMLPMSVRYVNRIIHSKLTSFCRCTSCGEYLYKGKKFNARKETVEGEEYLGIKIFRFYMRCTRCSAEITIKTDPKTSDYVAEFGLVRNIEPWRERESFKEEVKKDREEEEKGDAMKALENRTIDSKIEMDIIEGLEEIKQLNAKNAKIDADTLLEYHKQAYLDQQNKLDEEDEEELSNIVFKNSSNYVKRVADDEFDILDLPSKEDEDSEVFGPVMPPTKKPKPQEKEPVVVNKIKDFKLNILPIPKKEQPKPNNNNAKNAPKKEEKKEATSLLSLADYSDSD